MEWRVYSRTGRVFGAELTVPSVVRTNHGLIDANPGDWLIVDEAITRVRHVPAGYFQRMFSQVERPIPLKALAELSEIAVSRVDPLVSNRLGHACVRCGQHHTDREFEGEPTCSACELSIRAEREERMPCRHDGALMQKEILEDVIMDRCPECGGVWFDGGELEVLSAAIHRDAVPGVSSELGSRLLHGLLRARPE
ncbi:MAG: zf-TFIIB domain-containing protein [Gemmatimonadota bacterium]|nr:zf-TFIIB domain-containing protein [Gemmatimonadota bacterium]